MTDLAIARPIERLCIEKDIHGFYNDCAGQDAAFSALLEGSTMDIYRINFRTVASVAALLASLTVPCRATDHAEDRQSSLANDANVAVSSGTLKTVVIRGSFAKWPDKNHYKDWRVSIIRP